MYERFELFCAMRFLQQRCRQLRVDDPAVCVKVRFPVEIGDILVVPEEGKNSRQSSFKVVDVGTHVVRCEWPACDIPEGEVERLDCATMNAEERDETFVHRGILIGERMQARCASFNQRKRTRYPRRAVFAPSRTSESDVFKKTDFLDRSILATRTDLENPQVLHDL